VKRSQKFVRGYPTEFAQGPQKNSTQVKFSKTYPEKVKLIGSKENKLCGLQNLLADGWLTEKLFSS
jgi:hypothetical protein